MAKSSDKAKYRQNKVDFLALLKEIWMSDMDVVAHCRTEYTLWYNYVVTRRIKFRERRRLYNEQLKDTEKISMNDIYSVMQTALALYYTDELTVNFVPRSIWYDETAENLQNLAKFDYDEMGLDTLNYQVQRDRLFYWVWIRQLVGWDSIRKVPVWDVKDPLTMIPDPRWYWDISRFRFIWFESQMTKEQMTPEKWYFDVDFVWKTLDAETQTTLVAESQPRALNESPDTTDNWYCSVYHHYTILKGKKYLVTLINQRQNIVRFEEVMPMGTEEKKNPSLVQFPIILNYYDPIRNDPFGVSIPDLIEDKQRARSVIANLNLIKAKYEALWWIKLYNPYAVRNAADLEQPTVWAKYIPVNPEFSWGRIDNIIYDTNNTNNIKQDSMIFPSTLLQEEYMSTSIDTQQQWLVGWGKTMTKWENQSIQLNANMKFLLKSKINMWWERAFWLLWYQSYKNFFSQADEKFIRLNNGWWIKWATLKKRDFITSKDPEITIVSRMEKKSQDQVDYTNLMVIAPMYMQDPDTPKITKAFIKRKILSLSWVDRDEIMIMVPPSVEELQAKQRAILLDQDEDAPKIQDMNEDHQTYIIVYQWCEDTDAKWKAIQKRKEAIIMAQKQQAMQPQMMPWQERQSNIMQNQLWNSFSSMLANNSLQKMNARQVASAQDVAQV